MIGVNIHPDEDELVAPFIRNNKYGFVPVKAALDAQKSSYQVVGTPSNFLIDGEGRIIFRPRVHNEVTERTLELEIEALVKK